MKKNYSLILIAVVFAATALAAVWHLQTQPKQEAGVISVQYRGSASEVKVKDLSLSRVCGTIVNGKGESIEIDADGIGLADFLDHEGVADFERITAVAHDEYRAELYEEDVPNANIILEPEGSIRLIVFGDPDSKRNVSDIVRIEIQ